MKTNAKILLNKTFQTIWFGSNQKENFVSYGKQINRANWKSAQAMYLFSAVLTFLLCVFSVFYGGFNGFFLPYLGMFVVSLAMLAINQFIIKKHYKGCSILYYFWVAVLAGLITYARVVFSTTSCPLLISVLLLTAPLFLIDKPLKLSLVNVIITIVFLTVSHCSNSFEEGTEVIINMLLITMLSICLIYYFTKAKLSNIGNKQKLRKQRDTDYLTQLSTRGAGEKAVTYYLDRSDTLSVMMVMDLDNFKSVNDNYGHTKGDEVLAKTAIVVKNFFTEINFATRLGGDEFSIFVPDIPSREWVYEKVGELVALIKNSVLVEGKQVLSCSIGVAFSEDTLRTYDDMYRCADYALYEAKNKGKDTFAVFKKK